MAVDRRGQIAAFLVVVLVITLLGIMIFSLNKPVEIKPEPILAQQTKGIVEACLIEIAQDGAHITGQQGGFVTPRADKFNIDGIALGVFAHRGKITAPSRSELEVGLASYIDARLPACLKKYEAEIALSFSYKTSKSQVTITNSQIAINTDFPVEVRSGGTTESVRVFSHMLPVRLGLLRDLAEEIVQDRQSHLGYWDLTFLSELKVPVEMRVYNETYIVFSLLDNESITRIETPYVFNMALDSPPEVLP